MPLTKLQFQPGINRETTPYSAEGGWYDCDKVRFRFGFPETIGGWQKYSNNTFLGACRNLYPWTALDGTNYTGIGTHLKYYVERGGEYFDITPIRDTTTAGDVTFAATDGSAVITVTDTAHGALLNDFVTFSGAVDLGGNITASVLNREYQITRIVDGNSYEIEASVSANASDTGDGGASVVAAYQINTGLDTTVFGTGWGAGAWGEDGWGSGSETAIAGAQLRIISSDNFGEDLIFNVRDGGIYYWDESSGVAARAVALADLAGASGAPTLARVVLTSDQDRHILAFGCDPINDIGTQDPLLIRFSSQESPTDWTPTTTNTAGDLRISSGSGIVSVVQTKQQILVLTDVSAHTVQFIGPPFTFGLAEVSSGISVMGPNAAVAVGDAVFWMGKNEFYLYNGNVQQVPCTVKEYVFNNFNVNQSYKAFAAHNSSFSEVWWFYPSLNSNNVDRYVVYNYEQNIWYFGSLERTAWVDRGVLEYPIAASLDGYLYYHEFGLDDGSTNPSSALSAYIESNAVDVGDGDQYMFATRLIPDLTFRNSVDCASATMTIKARDYPGQAFQEEYPSTVSCMSMVPVGQFTKQSFIRLRGRAMALRLESSQLGTAWRLGSPRLDVRLDGRR